MYCSAGGGLIYLELVVAENTRSRERKGVCSHSCPQQRLSLVQDQFSGPRGGTERGFFSLQMNVPLFNMNSVDATVANVNSWSYSQPPDRWKGGKSRPSVLTTQTKPSSKRLTGAIPRDSVCLQRERSEDGHLCPRDLTTPGAGSGGMEGPWW